ncbi:hypothetical protein KIN20_034906 [Parelaphostrongylus tenuis]|uniref:DNA mismatch repair protein Mlh1 C-terminal domain-containing protein n=1 Tax=Parelaphostrongylus tenuis TaxID=148309 RepID=A0AAD5RAU2_PARTN|nr:hypothetical protein KIN20_034906 [Parelaphostrongylus tenuis]
MFLEKEAIIEDIRKAVENQLSDIFEREVAPRSISNTCQSILTCSQVLRIPSQTQTIKDALSFDNNSDAGATQPQSPAASKKRVDYELVRVDTKERRLDEFVSSTNAATSSSVDLVEVVGSQDDSACGTDASGQRVFEFESLERLRKRICNNLSQPLREFFKSLIFVGCVSVNSMLLQFGTGLYIVQLDKILEELFYETLIFSFGNFGSFKLENGANILDLLQLADIEDEHMVAALELLESQSAMLNDYFSIEIVRPDDVDQGLKGLETLYLATIPSIIDGYAPQLEGLPKLLMSLVKEVDWEQEEACFDGVCRALAHFFVIKKEFCSGNALSGIDEKSTPWLAVIRDILVPRVKSHLIPPDSLKDTIVRLADLHDLYKFNGGGMVFEQIWNTAERWQKVVGNDGLYCEEMIRGTSLVVCVSVQWST